MIIGHDRQLAFFKNVFENGELNRAYLFTGPEMIGKKLCAKEIYHILNNQKDPQIYDPDLFVLESGVEKDELTISIEDVRLVRQFLSRSAFKGPYRAVIIDNSDRMTNEASNALLKILEEPPAVSIFFLITSLPGLLPLTIRSRCQEIAFYPADIKLTEQFMKSYRLSAQDKDFIKIMGQGRLGFIHRLINIEYDQAKEAVADLRKLLKQSTTDRMLYAKKLIQSPNYISVVSYWLSWVSAHLVQSPGNSQIVRDLLTLNRIFMNPAYNHRLALEKFLIGL